MNFHGAKHYGDAAIIDFSSNINPLGVSQAVRDEITQHIHLFSKYPDIEKTELLETLSDFMQVLPSHIVCGNGAVDIIYKVIRAIGKEVVIFSPTFSEYRRGCDIAGLPYTERILYHKDTMQPMEDILFDIEDNRLYILCNPNNPTGTLLPPEMILRLLPRLQEKNSFLLIDESFIEFCDKGAAAGVTSAISQFQNVFVVRTSTKFFGVPGIRFGYGVCSHLPLLQRIRDMEEPWNINTAAYLAARVMFSDETYINKTYEWIAAERSFMFDTLSSFPNLTVFPSACNFFLIRLHTMSGTAFYERMLEQGIAIRKSVGFYGLDDQYVRLAVKGHLANTLLTERMQIVLT